MKISKRRFDHASSYSYKLQMKRWFVYILRCADNTLYCGITTDVTRRINEHNMGTASKCTRSRLPVSLETFVEVENRSQASQLEIKVKKQRRLNKINYLNSFNS